MFEIANFSRKSGRRASFVIFEICARPHNFGGILRGWYDFVFDEIVFCCINFINKNFYIFLEFFCFFVCAVNFFAAAMCNCVLLKMLVFVKNNRICVKSPKNCKNRPALPVKFAKNGGFLRVCGWFLGVFWCVCPFLPQNWRVFYQKFM